MDVCCAGLTGEEYIGESTIFIEDLKRTPSSRQILRLQTQPGSFDYSTGTLTVEVRLCVDQVRKGWVVCLYLGVGARSFGCKPGSFYYSTGAVTAELRVGCWTAVEQGRGQVLGLVCGCVS